VSQTRCGCLRNARRCSGNSPSVWASWQAFLASSEHLRLRWCDLDFENRSMVIHQPKLEGLRSSMPTKANQRTGGKLSERSSNAPGWNPGQRRFKHCGQPEKPNSLRYMPLHVVTAWCGNTPKVALSRYLMTTFDHHEQASALDVVVETDKTKAARNPARSTLEWPGTWGSTKRDHKTQPTRNPMTTLGPFGASRCFCTSTNKCNTRG
jgi:hypothetical protein